MNRASGGSSLWRAAHDRIFLRVRVTPKAGRDAVEGITDTAEGPALRVRVRSVPEDGAANAAVEALIARWLGLPGRAVEITSGHKSRLKSVAITGDVSEIEPRLATLLEPLQPPAK